MGKRKASPPRNKPRARTWDEVTVDQKPINPKWQKYYDRLVQLRDTIHERQADLTKDALEETPTLRTHLADAGTDSYDRDFALGILSSEQDSVYEIEEALDRIRH